VLFCKDSHLNEDDLFSNVDTSEDYEEFLEFLGDRISLENWTGFRGGLDVKGNLTGKESIFTNFKEHDIMFHVSTLLPFDSNDKQQLERKRHLGNDIVVVIYKEGNRPFSPNCIHSQFNNIFVVIQKIHEGDSKVTRYKVAFASKTQSNIFNFDPSPKFTSYEKTPEFREFFLTSLINGEAAAMKSSPELATRIQQVHLTLLKNLAAQFLPHK